MVAVSVRPASGEQEQPGEQTQAQQGVVVRSVFGERMNRLLLRLVISASRGDKDKTLAIAQEIAKIFEETLERESTGA